MCRDRSTVARCCACLSLFSSVKNWFHSNFVRHQIVVKKHWSFEYMKNRSCSNNVKNCSGSTTTRNSLNVCVVTVPNALQYSNDKSMAYFLIEIKSTNCQQKNNILWFLLQFIVIVEKTPDLTRNQETPLTLKQKKHKIFKNL